MGISPYLLFNSPAIFQKKKKLWYEPPWAPCTQHLGQPVVRLSFICGEPTSLTLSCAQGNATTQDLPGCAGQGNCEIFLLCYPTAKWFWKHTHTHNGYRLQCPFSCLPKQDGAHVTIKVGLSLNAWVLFTLCFLYQFIVILSWALFHSQLTTTYKSSVSELSPLSICSAVFCLGPTLTT